MPKALNPMKMAIPKIVGLTGGIGSGKSVVRRMLQEKGVPCLDADVATRDIRQDPAHPALVEIALALPDAMTPEGRLSPGSLPEVFAVDPEVNNRLRSTLQPCVIADMTQWATAQKALYVVWESALIIEAEFTSTAYWL
jgi:dephospho-CoA kinase